MNKLSNRLKDMPFMKRAMNANSTETQDDNNNNWFIDTGVGDICDELISKKNNTNNNENKTKKRCQEVVDSILHNSRIRMKRKEKKEPMQQQEEHTNKIKQNKQSKEHKKHKHKK